MSTRKNATHQNSSADKTTNGARDGSVCFFCATGWPLIFVELGAASLKTGTFEKGLAEDVVVHHVFKSLI